MSVALKKMPGVEDAKVSLNDGVATLKLKPGNTVTVDQVRKFVLSNGFTPKEAEVVASGKLVDRDGRLALDVTGTDVVYLVQLPKTDAGVSPLKNDDVGKVVTLRGRIPETADAEAKGRQTLEVVP